MRPIDVALRYEVLKLPPQRPELQGISMFQHHYVQCQTSRLVPLTHHAVQVALSAAADFLQSLIDSYDEYWGTVGVPANLTDLYSQMSVCWAFTDVISGKERRPTEAACQAMLQLMRRFQPKLRSFEWPDAQDFPHVTRRWPDEKQLRRQYLVFWTILHRRSHLHHDWLHVQRCKVSFVSPPSFLMHVLSVCWHGAASGNTLDCLSDLVWRFLARDDASFHVEATSLGPCSCNMSGILRPGHFCEVLRPRCIQGRAVYVLSVEGHANAEAIAATVMLDKSYHLYTSSKVGKTTHAWHIAFLLCLCVSTQSASSSCERIGSFLHNLEEGESRISAARIADRLRLKVAGVEAIGGERDELLVSNIVETISSSKSPLIQKSAMAKRRKKGQDATGSLSLVHRLAKSNEKAETSMIPSASLHREPGVIEDSLDFLYRNYKSELHSHRDFHAPCELDADTLNALHRVNLANTDGRDLQIQSMGYDSIFTLTPPRKHMEPDASGASSLSEHRNRSMKTCAWQSICSIKVKNMWETQHYLLEQFAVILISHFGNGIDIPLSELSTAITSGWRPQDPARQAEIVVASCINQKYLLDIAATGLIYLGHILVADGMSFICALKTMKQEWVEAGSPTAGPSSAADIAEGTVLFDERLVEIFHKGLPCDVITFVDEDPATRAAWFSSVHDEECNRFRATSLSQKLRVFSDAVTRANGSVEKATANLVDLLGSGAKPRVQKWGRAFRHIPLGLQEQLARFDTLPQSYIWDNAYIMGSGVNGRLRLPEDMALQSLELVKQAS
ncbi:unnamed protein product [Symbiodinium microadriaticum]|nr:unnamed protein product [Symbiodinium microadriaticum]